MNDRNITLTLNEHDTLQILALIRREIERDDRTWRPYWQRLAQHVERSITASNRFGIVPQFDPRDESKKDNS